MEENQLDYAAQASMELIEFLATCPIDEQEALLLQHVQKLSEDSSITSVFDPDEKGEWISGPKGQTLATYCSGRVALLDFFTYCCINCQHVLPDLYDLEQLYKPQDGLVVVGVHSAKFEAERLPSNVLHAVKRLNIKHPVLNDPEASLWGRLGIHCWPTLVLLNPEGKPILVLAGEGHREILFRTVSVALRYFKEQESLKMSLDKDIIEEMVEAPDVRSLKFPGKVTLNPFCNYAKGDPWLVISDSGNNRLILIDYFENVTDIIGGMEAELKDGNFEEARFNNPQGVCWLKSSVFFVCDTGNHVIRKILLEEKNVEIFAGTGVQAEFGDQGGLRYCQQSLASPWDIILYRTADMDMSIRVPGDDSVESDDTESLKRVLLVACAGSHQIWAIFLDTTVWWKYKTYAEGFVLPIVGSGREENRNNRYPNSASLAQPSGLALKKDAVFIADSESSSIRYLDLTSGQVSPLAGADRNPSNLFAYGDLDGIGYSARLQHPLGVACCQNSNKVYVADTYNHKLKAIESTNGDCSTIFPTADSTITLSEPGGLCLFLKTQSLIIADTNNHRLVSMDVNSKEAKVLQVKFPVAPSKVQKTENYTKNNLITCTETLKISNSSDAKFILIIDCDTVRGDKELHLTPEAPQRWLLRILDTTLENDLTNEWEVIGGIRNGKEIPTKVELHKKFRTESDELVKCILRVEFFISLCEAGLCFIKRFAVDCKLLLANDISQDQTWNLTVMVTPEGDINASIT